MTKRLLWVVVLSLAALATARPVAQPAQAAPAIVTFNVNSTLDKIDDNVGDGNCHTATGTCTLRAAVMEADVATNAGGAIIVVPAGIYSLTIPYTGTDGANNGDLNLTAGQPIVIRIVGAGAASTIIDANQNDRVLTVDAGRTVVISGITLRDGAVSASYGAGILNQGTLTLDHTTFSGNQGPNSFGGGFYNNGKLTVVDSTIGPNNLAFVGGGIGNEGTLTVERSTVYDNIADTGGGIFNKNPHSLTLINSTVRGNDAASEGGGIWNNGLAIIYNSTIVFNDAQPDPGASSAAGGVFSGAASVSNLRNSLLAGNVHDNSSDAADCAGSTLHSYGRNLFGTLTPCSVDTPAGGNWDAINSLFLIGPLQDNGGPTWTHALLAGSNAIDGGDPAQGCVGNNFVPLATDQRGFPRVVGASCDIGAFEFLPPELYLPMVVR